MVSSLLAFLPVAVVLVLVPGVNNLVVVQQTVAAGVRGGLAAVAGTSLGILGWSAAVAVGLGTLVKAHPDAFVAARWTGAGLLVLSGARALDRTLRTLREDPVTVPEQHRPVRTGTRGSFTAALSTSVVNPRCPLTALSVLPPFVAPGASIATTTLALGLVWVIVAAAWNLVGVWLVDRGRDLFARPRVRRTTEVVSAVALVALGVSVVAGVA